MKCRHKVLMLLGLLAIVTYLDRVCISVSGLYVQKNLHISPPKWGWVVSIFAITYAGFEMPTGSLADRYGPRRILTRIVLCLLPKPASPQIIGSS